jgi:hypothetical protein
LLVVARNYCGAIVCSTLNLVPRPSDRVIAVADVQVAFFRRRRSPNPLGREACFSRAVAAAAAARLGLGMVFVWYQHQRHGGAAETPLGPFSPDDP